MSQESDIDLDELVEELREKQDAATRMKNERKHLGDYEGMAWHAGREQGFCVSRELVEDMRQDSDTPSTKVVCPWCMEGFASEQEWADAS